MCKMTTVAIQVPLPDAYKKLESTEIMPYARIKPHNEAL